MWYEWDKNFEKSKLGLLCALQLLGQEKLLTNKFKDVSFMFLLNKLICALFICPS